MKIIDRQASNTLPDVQIWTVQPANIARPFLVAISTPTGPTATVERHGLLVTDGNGVGLSMATFASYLAMGGDMPAQVVVAVGYPVDQTDPKWHLARNIDLTPKPWPEWDARYGNFFGAKAPASGDSERFLHFLTSELMPAIERDCDVDPANWTLAGHSLGGLFATTALITAPAKFKRYLAVGSSYWWRRGEPLTQAKAFAAQSGAVDISAYLAAGELETRDTVFKAQGEAVKSEPWTSYLEVMGGIPDIVEDTKTMASILGQRPGLRVKAETIAGEGHSGAPFAAYSRGLQWLYAQRNER